MRKLSLVVSMMAAASTFNSDGMMARAKQLAGEASQLFAKIYKTESIRTAVVRSAMVLPCLVSGTCSYDDAVNMVLALASVITATSYDATGAKRYRWLPSQFNLVADGIATIASFDASYLPITGTGTEAAIRSALGALSTTATGLTLLPDDVVAAFDSDDDAGALGDYDLGGGDVGFSFMKKWRQKNGT